MADGSTEIDPGILRVLPNQHQQVAADTLAWASAPSATTAHTTGADTKLPPDPQGPPPGGQDSSDGKHDKRPDRRDKPPTAAKHYWLVELDPPSGASTALKSFVAMAESAIQSAVDLLGRGVPELPPEVGDLLRTVVYQALGKGETTVAYQQALSAVQARQTALLNYDNEVAKTAIEVAAKKDETLAAIKNIVHTLQTDLKVPITGKHKATQEAKLMEKIATAVEQVYRKVEAVYQNNQNMAGSGNDSSGSGSSGSSGNGSSGSNSSGGSSGSGGGDGGIGQIFQTLAMLVPMGVMAATPVVTALMENDKQRKEHEEQEKAKSEQAAPGTTAPGAAATTPGTAAPTDPNAAATATADPNAAAPTSSYAPAPAATAPASQAPSAPATAATQSDPNAGAPAPAAPPAQA
ncbi:hypothetical protein [Nocardia vinacea]|uniref:hypothetical protein n=1 Tax=Nocardia vinacea TaxID=96468 RepID=UPI000595157B|nr:hypothetical protein [Nocardia vinacea]